MGKRSPKYKPPREDGLLTAAFYGRVSSNLQKVEESIEQQRDHCYRWAAQNGHRIIDEYTDEAISGTKNDRPQFNEMIARALSKERPYDTIIVWNSARMARNTLHALITRERLKANNVSFVMQNIHIDEDDEEAAALLIPMIHAFDEVTSIRIGNDVRRAQRARAERGEWVGGTPPLGRLAHRKIVNGRPFKTLIEDPDTAPLVRRMYDMADNGYPAERIANTLSHEGFRTRKGKLFGRNSVVKILNNESNKGDLVHGLQSKSNKHPVIRVEKAFDPLVPRELFDRVQEKLAERAPHKTRKTRRNHPLTGILKCAKCGDRMKTNRSTSIYAYYICSNRGKPAPYGCDAKGIKMLTIELQVKDAACKKILTPQNMNRLIAIIDKESEKLQENSHKTLRSLDQQLQTNAQEKSRLLKLVKENEFLDSSVIAHELSELQEQQYLLIEAKIQEEIEVNRHTRIVQSKNKIIAFVAKLKEDISTGDRTKLREILHAICDHITAEKDKHVTIHYKIPIPPRRL